MKRIIITTTLALCIIAGASVATAQQLPPESTQKPYTTRYQVIDDLVAMQAQIDALEARVSELEWRSAYDRQQWALARREDQKRITSLEVTGIQLFEICKR